MTSFDLRGRHAGREAWVLGGAETLPAEMERCPDGALLISANEHGCRLRRCDYIVARDDIGERLAPWGAPRISQHLWAEHPYLDPWPIANSAAFGVWVAFEMDCRSAVIAGVDCYRTAYFHDKAARRPLGSEKFRFAEWKELKQRIPKGFLRAAGGPLVDIFGSI